MPTLTKLLVVTLPLLLAAGPNEALRVVVEQALDQPTNLTIEDVPLPEAINTIAEETGLGIAIGPESLAYLPYGEATRVSVRLRNARLRDGIRTLCDQIGMDYAIVDTGVVLFPAAPLARLGRPATWEELGLLSSLMQARWQGTADEFDSIADRIRFVEMPGDPSSRLSELRAAVVNGGAGRAAELLEHACGAIDAVWYPWDENIVVIGEQAQLRRQLQWPVSLRYQNAPLIEILHGLSEQAGIPIGLDPNTAATLSDRARRGLSLIAEGVTVEEALAQLAIATGLTYEWRGDAIMLHHPRGTEAEDASAGARTASDERRRDRIVGKVVVPSDDGKHTYEWFIRESDLTEEERERVEEIKREGIEAMQRDLHE